jgi:PAS domain S-box-containing protein
MPKSVSRAEQSSVCAFAISEGNRIVAWNGAAAAALGWNADEVLGRPASEVIEAKDLFGNRWCAQYCGLREMSRRGEKIETISFLIKTKNGQFEHFFGSVHPIEPETRRSTGQENGREKDLLFEFQRDRRRRTTGIVVERLLQRQLDSGEAVPRKQEVLQLTARQTQVLSLLADGLDPATIAKQLGVSITTVRNHIQHSLVALNCHSQVTAVAIAIRKSLI